MALVVSVIHVSLLKKKIFIAHTLADDMLAPLKLSDKKKDNEMIGDIATKY